MEVSSARTGHVDGDHHLSRSVQPSRRISSKSARSAIAHRMPCTTTTSSAGIRSLATTSTPVRLRRRSPFAAIGTGSRVRPSAGQPVEEASAEQAEPRPAGDDRARPAPAYASRIRCSTRLSLTASRHEHPRPTCCRQRGPRAWPASDRIGPRGRPERDDEPRVTGGAMRSQRCAISQHVPGAVTRPNRRALRPVEAAIEKRRTAGPSSQDSQLSGSRRETERLTPRRG